MINTKNRQPRKLNAEEWLSINPFKGGFFNGSELGVNITVLNYTQENFGDGPSLHVHKYDEIFIVLQGKALFKIGAECIEAKAGDVLFGPANVPHKFKNIGLTPLETMDLHLSDKWIQEDLVENDPDW